MNFLAFGNEFPGLSFLGWWFILNLTKIKGQAKLENLSDYSVVLYGSDVDTDVARII